MANPYFNATYYLTNNPDVFAAGINTVEGAWNHYVNYGAAESLAGAASRKPVSWFDAEYYLSNNPDLSTAGLTAGQLFDHFTTYGIDEGRAPSANAILTEANLLAYAKANEDLMQAFDIAEDAEELTPAQQQALARQFYAYGYNEDRPGAPFGEGNDPVDGDFTLTVGIDNIQGTAGDDVVNGPLVQNFLGQMVNTFETGDKIDGGAGFDTLNVTLTHSQSTNVDGSAPAISATVANVEVINIRNQYDADDGVVNLSNIDAELHSGVQQYWSDNSRYTLQIEDIRQLPEELTFGMRQTDPVTAGNDGAGFRIYFDPAQLDADRSTSGDSSLTLTLVDNTPDANELENFPVNGIVFKLGGTEYTVQTEGALGATYAEFAENLQAALAENPDLADITVTLNENNTITLVDPEGEAFEAVGYTWVNNVVPSDGNLQWNMSVGAAIEDDQPVTTNVVLDAVGRTSQGGTLDIGSMAEGGVEVFNVSVDRDSWVTALESQEYFGTGDRHLETVNLTSIGANGDVAIGEAVTGNTGELDDRVVDGLTDVREVLNKGFVGDMYYGVTLTGNAIGRYLDDAEGEVQFTYEGGEGNDNVTIDESGGAGLSADDDFAMSVDLGAGNDRLNIAVDNVSNVTVDGGEGDNTIAVSRSHGMDDDDTFAEFANFQTYEVEGGSSDHDFESMQGVTTINVATVTPTANVSLINVADDADVLITGKNQTLVNSNANQNFGTISIDSDDVADGDETLRVTLQNTARLDGTLTVAGLTIGDLDGDDDGIRTLELVSAGARDTTNEIGNLNAALVNTFNLTGTQDLVVDITAAANSTATVDAQRDALVVNGADLGGSLDLGIAAAIINDINDASKTVTLTGSADEADVLRIAGDVAITNNTTVNAFETVVFEGDEGEVDVTNFNGVGLYVIEEVGALGFEMSGMKGNEQVWADADDLAGELTFIAASEATTNVLDLELETDGIITPLPATTINVQSFRTISLELTGTSTTDDQFDITLELLDEDGIDSSDAAYDETTVYARNLVVTGGGDQGAAGGPDVDSVDLGTLNNILTHIDLSEYVGQVTLALETDVITGRNVTIELNGYGATIDEGVATDNIVTYKFTTDLIEGEVVEIENFDADGLAGIGVDEVSILDLRELGITGLADLSMADDGTDTTITSNGDHDFVIVLTNVLVADLSNENFMFAA